MSNEPFAHRPDEQPQNTAFEQAYGQPYGQAYDQAYGQQYEQSTYGYGPPTGCQAQPGGHPLAKPYASWGARVGARLVDSLIAILVFAVFLVPGIVIAINTTHTVNNPDGTTSSSGTSGWGVALIILSLIVYIFFDFWNRAIRQGKRGQSLGKKLFHITVVDENTGMPTGAGMGAGRWGIEFVMSAISSCIGFLSLLDLLWPLWDAKNQTLHDKVVHTVVVEEPRHT